MVTTPHTVGRYSIYEEIASGGMATVHLGRQHGMAGLARTVAVKRLHPALARDANVVKMLLDEARIVARISHPNVVTLLDVVEAPGELFLVLDYVHGESLSRLSALARERKERLPVGVACAIASALLRGLHAAHEARDEAGQPLGIVHRDVSPQNVLVGRDGGVRLVDFGVAKARGLLHETRDGSLKGKLAYMAPEQVRGRELGRWTDVYGASIVLWELLTGRPLFVGDSEAAVIEQVMLGDVAPPSRYAPHLPEELDAITLKGLSLLGADRFPSALAMAEALEKVSPPPSSVVIGDWVDSLAKDGLDEREERLRAIERATPAAPVWPARVGTTPAASGRRGWAVGTVVATATLLVGALALGIGRPEGDAKASLPVAAPVDLGSAAAPALGAAPAPPASGVAPAEEASAVVELDDVPPPAGPSRARTDVPRPRKAKAKEDCSSPYTRDELGRKIYKLACIER